MFRAPTASLFAPNPRSKHLKNLHSVIIFWERHRRHLLDIPFSFISLTTISYSSAFSLNLLVMYSCSRSCGSRSLLYRYACCFLRLLTLQEIFLMCREHMRLHQSPLPWHLRRAWGVFANHVEPSKFSRDFSVVDSGQPAPALYLLALSSTTSLPEPLCLNVLLVVWGIRTTLLRGLLFPSLCRGAYCLHICKASQP